MQYQYTFDWVTEKIPIFSKVTAHLAGKLDITFLEIGCFEGRSTVWWLQNILTHESSKIVCIDPFTGSDEHKNLDLSDLHKRFLHNTQEFRSKIQLQHGFSGVELCKPEVRNKQYDFVFVDGCHRTKEVLEDAALSFGLLKNNGIMLFDDYEWDLHRPPRQRPQLGIESFINCYKLHLDIVYRSPIFGKEVKTSLIAIKKK